MSQNSNQFIVSTVDPKDLVDLISSKVSEYIKEFTASLTKEEKIFTKEQAADYLKITIPTLDKYTKMGKILRYDICDSGIPRYKQKDLDNCLIAQKYINK